jgi:thioredoxin-related protein
VRWLFALALALAFSVHAKEVPDWFGDSFLDLREDVADASKEGKRVLLYFFQNGCKYCRQLVSVTLADAKTIDKVRRHFVPLPINIYGAREVTLKDGRALTEKELAAFHKVRFTPTIVFLDEKGDAVHRIHGYQPPEDFYKLLDPALPARLD